MSVTGDVLDQPVILIGACSTKSVSFNVASYNQPTLGSSPAWCPDAVTFANQSTINANPRGIFVDSDDSVYFADYHNNQIVVWYYSNASAQLIPSGKIWEYSTLFVTANKDVYLENGTEAGRVDKWPRNGTGGSSVARFNSSCYGIFIDLNNTLYCSMFAQNQVASVSLANNSSIPIVVAGTGGSPPYQLSMPWGIFVDINFDLYVADASNNRIQRFRSGELNGTTVAGQGFPYGLWLNYPTDVVLDSNGDVYIADNSNYRIVRAGTSNFQCIAGCGGSPGSTASQLKKAYSLRFDSQGNIYVADEYNARIQKFMVLRNSCCEHSRLRYEPLSIS